MSYVDLNAYDSDDSDDDEYDMDLTTPSTTTGSQPQHAFVTSIDDFDDFLHKGDTNQMVASSSGSSSKNNNIAVIDITDIDDDDEQDDDYDPYVETGYVSDEQTSTFDFEQYISNSAQQNIVASSSRNINQTTSRSQKRPISSVASTLNNDDDYLAPPKKMKLSTNTPQINSYVSSHMNQSEDVSKDVNNDLKMASVKTIPFQKSSARGGSTALPVNPPLKKSSKLVRNRDGGDDSAHSDLLKRTIKEQIHVPKLSTGSIINQEREDQKLMEDRERRKLESAAEEMSHHTNERKVLILSQSFEKNARDEELRAQELENRRRGDIERRKNRIVRFIASVSPTDDAKKIELLKKEPPRIPLCFSNVDQYASVYEPHMYAETFAQIQRAYEEEEFPGEEVIICTDPWIERDYLQILVHVVNRETETRTKERMWYNEYDYVMIILDDNSKVFGHLVQNKIEHVNLLRKDKRSLLTVRFWQHKLPTGLMLAQNKKIRLQKLCPLAPTVRAFFSIFSLDQLSPTIASTVLAPDRVPISNIYEPQSLNLDRVGLNSAFKQYLVDNFNPSQICAILCVYSKREGFTLIQGPPGSGKTATIAGTIAALLKDRTTDQIKKRILVCAPSNAAVDELIARINKKGLVDKNGEVYRPNVVRLGVKSKVHYDVVHLYIDNLVQKEFDAKKRACVEKYDKQRQQIQSELDLVRKNIDLFRSTIDEMIGKDSSSTKLLETKGRYELAKRREQTFIDQMISNEQAKKKEMANVFSQQKFIRQKILSNTDVFCTTLGSVTHHTLPSISNIIIDESCQCVEPECIAPIVINKHCKSITLVGDPQQLPPTVLSKLSSNNNYTQSLMERLLKAGAEKILLDTQYRMHPSISRFPSKEFYENKLLNGPNCETEGKWLYESNRTSFKITPYSVHDVSYSRESRGQLKSLRNVEEAKYVAFLYESILNTVKDPSHLSGAVGIISPYKEQIQEIKYWVSKLCGPNALRNVQIATVDAFQGKEKDIVIFSCVRSAGGESNTIGFLNDVRRMNVGITRAKYAMYIVCNSQYLSKNEIWEDLIESAKSDKCYHHISTPPTDSLLNRNEQRDQKGAQRCQRDLRDTKNSRHPRDHEKLDQRDNRRDNVRNEEPSKRASGSNVNKGSSRVTQRRDVSPRRPQTKPSEPPARTPKLLPIETPKREIKMIDLPPNPSIHTPKRPSPTPPQVKTPLTTPPKTMNNQKQQPVTKNKPPSPRDNSQQSKQQFPTRQEK